MLIVYASKTGNVNRFIKKTNLTDIFRIISGNEIIKRPFILLTYTTGISQIPSEVSLFLKNNDTYIRAVVGSGNKNWGDNYCRASQIIKDTYKIPLLMNFELSGNTIDVEKFLKTYEEFTQQLI